MQGMISQGEVELSVISKNFFFTFYNLFIFYTVLGSATNLTATLDNLKDALKDTSYVANQLATRIEDYGQFYINLIILQGLGLLPLRLLEFGSLSLYPITLMGAKTPRGKDIRYYLRTHQWLIYLQISPSWSNRPCSNMGSSCLRPS